MLALVNTAIVEPRSAAALAGLQNKLAATQISFEVQPHVFYEGFRNHVLYVEDVCSAAGAAVWKNVFDADISIPGAPKITIAKEAVVSASGPEAIRLHLINGETTKRIPAHLTNTRLLLFRKPTSPSACRQWPKPAQDTVPVAQLSTRELYRQKYNPNKEFARWYWIEFNRRLALPTACLVLVLIGIPLGLSAKKGGKGAGFVLTIILVFIYYFVSIIGVSLARGGKISPVLGVWMANIVFGLIGLVLLSRTDRIPVELGIGQMLLGQFKISLASFSIPEQKSRQQTAANGAAGFSAHAFLSFSMTTFCVALSAICCSSYPACWCCFWFLLILSCCQTL